MIDVVGLAPAGRAIALAPATSAVTDAEARALASSEESIFPAHIHHLAVCVEVHRHHARLADMALDRRNADGFGLALDEAETGAGAQVVVGDEYLHRGTAATHESIRAREGAEVHELDEGVEGELLRGARVRREVGTRGLVRVDETGAATPRRRDAVED